MNDERRQQILDAVAAWLETMDDDARLDGFDTVQGGAQSDDDDATLPDLASLTAAVIACAKDTQIQSKLLRRLVERLDADVGYEAAMDDLLDNYDRVERCAVEARRVVDAAPRWFGARQRAQSVADALALVLASLEERLGRRGLDRIVSTGRPFDPQCMRAVATDGDSPSASSPLRVVETLRSGFRRGTRIIRVAEVRVGGSDKVASGKQE